MQIPSYLNTSNATPQDLMILMLLDRVEQLETCLDTLQRDCIMRDILGVHTDYNYIYILFICFQSNISVDEVNNCENLDNYLGILQQKTMTKQEFIGILSKKPIKELDSFWKYLYKINKITVGITSIGYEEPRCKKISFVRDSKTYFTVE